MYVFHINIVQHVGDIRRLLQALFLRLEITNTVVPMMPFYNSFICSM